ncbi:MAG: hypothetical protein Q8N09_04130 [Thermodesulfovibrionia bacterium]|nr:hypothetical protein [Thermodesulfovibrionia bacterium]
MRKEGAQSLWIDEATPRTDPEVKYEFRYLKKHFKSINTDVKLWAYKLIFVQENITKRETIDYKKLTFLSCSVIVNYSSSEKSQSYLLYSVAAIPQKYLLKNRTPIPLMNYYFHSFKDYPFTFCDNSNKKVKFSIRGAPFFQKNDITSFCMQSALATILNNLSPNNKLILPNHINQIYGAPLGSDVLFDKQKVLKVMKKQKLFSKEILFDQESTINLFKFLFKRFGWPPSASIYPWMESGFPGFIVFHTRAGNLHVVPIIGHTLSTDSWQPEADIRYSRRVRFHFRPVSAWVDNFLIHDDNFGMYLCYPTSKLAEKKNPKKYLTDHIIFITKENIKLLPDKLEINLIGDIRRWFDMNKKVSEKDNTWLYKIINERNAPLVSRTLSINKNDYIENLRERDSEKNKIPENMLQVIKKQLPDIFWLTEITLPDLYIANKAALISIVTKKNSYRQVFIRFPKFCYLYIKNEYFKVTLPTGSHYKLFERPNDIPTYDW